MPAPERRSFERRALASRQGREQVARARKLHAQLDQIADEVLAAPEERATAPLIAGSRESLWEKLRRLFAPAPVLRYAMAAAASLIVFGGLWLLREEGLLRRQVAQLTADRDLALQSEKNLQKQLDAERGELTSRIKDEQRRLEVALARNDQIRAEMRQPSPRPPEHPAPEGDFVELALASGIERNSPEPRKLSIPMGLRMVKLQLELDPSVSHRAYRVELSTAGGAQVWVQGGLTARQTEWGRFVTLTIPTRALQAGEHELILFGSTNEKKGEVAGYYYFIASPSGARRQ
jgi:hypothetical protein